MAAAAPPESPAEQEEHRGADADEYEYLSNNVHVLPRFSIV